MRSENVNFENLKGQALAGRIDYPLIDDPIAFAIYAHCFTCSKNLKAIGRITSALARHGIATLRFDFAGLGQSEGDFADTNFTTNVEDLRAAANYLLKTRGTPEILIGHSLGGAVAMAGATELPQVRAVATVAAPSSPSHIRRHLVDDLERIQTHGEADVTLAGRSVPIRQQLLDDIERHDLENMIADLRRPLLILHSPIDNTVGIENAATLFAAARHPKSFVALDGADHLLTVDRDATYAADVIAAWASTYLSGEMADRAQPDFTTDAPESVTTVRTESGFRTEVISNGFGLVADEPIAVGGTNTGPTPYDYLLTALGTCTSMTLRMYADRKQWPLAAVTVTLKHAKVHASDCAECDTREGVVDHVDRQITLEGDLDQGQRDRLLEIADRCPVHRTLHGEVVIKTVLIEPAP